MDVSCWMLVLFYLLKLYVSWQKTICRIFLYVKHSYKTVRMSQKKKEICVDLKRAGHNTPV